MDKRRPQLIVRRSTLLLVAASLVLGVFLGATAIWHGGPDQACVTQPTAFFTSADLPGLTATVDQDAGSLPMGLGGNPASRGLVAGRSRGWVVSLAFSGQYKAENDAQARRLGYTPGMVPMVPLTGSIVSSNTGILEVYETDLLFDSAATASTFLETMRAGSMQDQGSMNGSPLPAVSVTSQDPSSFIALTHEGSDPIRDETSVGLVERIGRTILEITVRGGTAVNAETIAPLRTVAEADLHTACGSNATS